MPAKQYDTHTVLSMHTCIIRLDLFTTKNTIIEEESELLEHSQKTADKIIATSQMCCTKQP